MGSRRITRREFAAAGVASALLGKQLLAHQAGQPDTQSWLTWPDGERHHLVQWTMWWLDEVITNTTIGHPLSPYEYCQYRRLGTIFLASDDKLGERFCVWEDIPGFGVQWLPREDDNCYVKASLYCPAKHRRMTAKIHLPYALPTGADDSGWVAYGRMTWHSLIELFREETTDVRYSR